MIIFLDFDGVLHPTPSGEQGIFCHLERFENILRQFPLVCIVISSSWRLTYPEDVIVGIFSDDVQDRIIGMTPSDNNKTEYPRHFEILTWISDAKYTGAWIALDDAEDEFPEATYHLLLCETAVGFDDVIAERLKCILDQNDFVS
jgi:hypothetical protein